MKKRVALQILLFLCSFVSWSQLPDYLQQPGPKNSNEYSYVYIHIIRLNEPQSKKWYGLHINELFVAKIADSCKYTIKYPVTPLTVHFSYAKEPDIRINSPQANAHYYFKATVLKDEVAKVDPEFSFVQVPIEEGQQDFEAAGFKHFTIYYPHSLGEDLPLTKKDVFSFQTAEFDKKKFDYFNIEFSPPAWLHNLLIHSSFGYMFIYANKPLSKTYSEYLKITPVEAKNLNSESDLKELVNKKLKSGKAFVGKKEKLTSFDTVSCRVDSLWSTAFYSVKHDYGTTVKQNAGYLESREIRVYFYTIPPDAKGLIWQIEYSIRGGEEELWSKEEMLQRINEFIKNIKTISK